MSTVHKMERALVGKGIDGVLHVRCFLMKTENGIST